MRFMLLQNYEAPEWDCPPMDQWTPADVRAHIEFQVALNADAKPVPASNEYMPACAAPCWAWRTEGDSTS